MIQGHIHTFITKRYNVVNVHWNTKVCDGGIDLIRKFSKMKKKYWTDIQRIKVKREKKKNNLFQAEWRNMLSEANWQERSWNIWEAENNKTKTQMSKWWETRLEREVEFTPVRSYRSCREFLFILWRVFRLLKASIWGGMEMEVRRFEFQKDHSVLKRMGRNKNGKGQLEANFKGS